nr:MAG TPA: hypothetical protein [Caudoviricetes sp.]
MKFYLHYFEKILNNSDYLEFLLLVYLILKDQLMYQCFFPYVRPQLVFKEFQYRS